jgi:GntR family transcriptional repressor for pyruvate dehydrogenase complex
MTSTFAHKFRISHQSGTICAVPARSPLLEPVRPERSVDAIVDRLITAIAVADFSPGERLPPERELAGTLGVGRPTLRAALARLREAGYVEPMRGRYGGHVVQPGDGWGRLTDGAVRRTLGRSWEDLAEISDLRCLVEATIARTAAERRSRDHLRAMTGALARFDEASDPIAARRADRDLHAAVVAAAGNPRLGQLSRELLAQVNIGLPIEPFPPALLTRAGRQHRELVEAIRAGDAERAGAIAGTHFEITREALERAMRRVR